MKKLLGFLLLLLLGAGAAAGVMYWRIHQPYRGYQAAEQFVDLPSGTGSVPIGERLVAAGVVRDVATFRAALWISHKGRRLRAGE